MTLWHPDTCACAIEYSDDGKLTSGTIHARCTKHAGIADNKLLDELLKHNRKKNEVKNYLIGKYGLPNDSPLQVGYDPNDMGDDPVLIMGLAQAASVNASDADVDAKKQFGSKAVKIIS